MPNYEKNEGSSKSKVNSTKCLQQKKKRRDLILTSSWDTWKLEQQKETIQKMSRCKWIIKFSAKLDELERSKPAKQSNTKQK